MATVVIDRSARDSVCHEDYLVGGSQKLEGLLMLTQIM